MSAPAAAATADRPGPAHLEHEGFSIRSNEGTVEDLQRELGVEADPAATDPPNEDPAAGAEPATDPPGDKLKAGEVHKRIAKTTYEREEANRQAAAEKERADKAEAELARLRSERTAAPTTRETAEPTADQKKQYEDWKRGIDAGDPPPEESAFETYAKYLDARDEWNERRIDRKHERAAEERHQHERFQRVQAAADKFHARMDAEAAKDADFAAIIKRVQIPAGPILDTFLTTDIPEALARHLDANPETLKKLIAMPPGRQLAEIKKLEGRVEAHLEAQTTAAPAGSAAAAKPSTKAHPPINPVAGSHVAATDDEPGDDASDEEWFAYHERQRKAKR